MNVLKVEDIMVKDVYSASLPGTRDDVLDILRNKNISGVPVLKDDKVVGIVSRTNILKNPEEEQLALIMSRNPITINLGSTIFDAARLLYEKKIRRLPVVENGKLKGLITTSDVISSISKMGIDSQIKPYVKENVYTIWTGTPLSIVSYQMQLADVKACPVIDSDMNLAGILSDRDIVSASVIEDRVEKSDMSSGTDDDDWTWESMRDILNIYYSVSKVRLPPGKVASDLMVKNPITAMPISKVGDCALRMRRNKIDQMPIVDTDGKLCGILRDHDLLKALIDAEDEVLDG
ncbi:MAG: CBS domain-containing protein [Methanosarcinaceae archaeon]|nr:CBS domain-containing protein [Methanosarcinaceae archaeon]